MSRRVWQLLIPVLALAAVGIGDDVSAQPGTTPTLYVGSSIGDDIVVVDVATQKVVADINVGHLVHAVCAQADGRRVFTTIESENTLKVIDTATNKVINTIALPGRPNECAATNDGHFVVVPIVTDNTVVIVDTTQNKIVKTLPVQHPHNCFTKMGGSNDDFYCEERGRFQIDRIDLKTLDFSDKIPVGGDPRPFVVTADEKIMYVALSGLHGFATVDVPNRTIAEVALPPAPFSPCTIEPVNTPTHGLALTPDGKRLWITSVPDAGVYVYDLTAKKLSKEIATGKCPNWISISSDGKYVTVSGAESDEASIIDARTEREIARVKVGKGPKRLLVVDVPSSPL